MACRRGPCVLSVVTLVLVIGGCAAIGLPEAGQTNSGAKGNSPAPVEDRSNVEAVVRRLAYLSKQSPSTLKPHFDSARTNFENSGDPGNRLELSWLLAQPGTDFQNRARASKLLDEYLDKTESGSSFAALATLMRAELRQQDRRINALDDSREQLAAESSERRALEVQISTLTGLLETLQQQFEKLKEIEREIN